MRKTSRTCVHGCVCVCVSHQWVSVGVMQQPSLPKDSAPPPLNVMHRLDQPHHRDVAAEAGAGGGTEDNGWIRAAHSEVEFVAIPLSLTELCLVRLPLGGSVPLTTTGVRQCRCVQWWMTGEPSVFQCVFQRVSVGGAQRWPPVRSKSSRRSNRRRHQKTAAIPRTGWRHQNKRTGPLTWLALAAAPHPWSRCTGRRRWTCRRRRYLVLCWWALTHRPPALVGSFYQQPWILGKQYDITGNIPNL